MRRRDLDELTDREREVLELLQRDFTNEQIAQRLDISLDGAKYHVSQILSKLGVATREEAAAWPAEERRSLYWKLGFIGGAAALAAVGALAVVLTLPWGGENSQLEPGVLARGADARSAEPHSSVSIVTPTPIRQAPPAVASPQVTRVRESDPEPGPSDEISDVPPGEPRDEPPDEPTPEANSEPTPSSGPPETPSPTDCSCSGIQGRIVASPICPAEPYPPVPECAPRPVQATLIVWNADRSEQILQVASGEDGNFRVPLPEGEYYIEPQGSACCAGAADPRVITVPPDRFVELELHYDTGIR